MAFSSFKWSMTTLLFLGHLLLSGFTKPEISALPLHPFYVSVTEIEYNAGEKALEMSIKVFTDDFEKVLVKATGGPVDIYRPKDKALLEKQIADYFKKHLLIKADGKPLVLEYVGYEIEEQSTFGYFQVSNLAKAPKKIEISNAIFYEVYEKQISIMHLNIGGSRKSTKLDYPATEAIFEF